MANEMIKVDANVCRTCKYYWGDISGSYVKSKDAKSLKYNALCGYYHDTGKHRCDDFDPNRKKKPDQDLGWCNKYEPHDGINRPSDSLPVKRTYIPEVGGMWQ